MVKQTSGTTNDDLVLDGTLRELVIGDMSFRLYTDGWLEMEHGIGPSFRPQRYALEPAEVNMLRKFLGQVELPKQTLDK
jgi:hypothetical protein